MLFFSDEKFNLNIPKGLQYYWHGLGRGNGKFSKIIQGDSSVIVCIGYCTTSKTIIKFLTTRLNCEKYIKLLDVVLIPFARGEFESSYIFQQDNAPCQRAKKNTRLLESKGINLMKSPSGVLTWILRKPLGGSC